MADLEILPALKLHADAVERITGFVQEALGATMRGGAPRAVEPSQSTPVQFKGLGFGQDQ